jgi:glutamate racemase
MDNRPIGFLDSGVGGLTIWRATKQLLPQEDLIMVADTAYFPYGEQPPDTVRLRCERISAFLCRQDCKLIVLACNTATIHAIHHLRQTFPSVPFVGVVPVVKTLARRTRTGTIAILSTPSTAESEYLSNLIREFAADKTTISVSCDGLADLVEAGETTSQRTVELLTRQLAVIKERDADVVGLGCTHYPFLRKTLKRILGNEVRLYDSSRPVARRVRQVLVERDALGDNSTPSYQFYTSGNPEQYGAVMRKLLHRTYDVERWDER